MNFAVIGYPISHSFSPAFFTQKFADWNLPHTYQALPVPDLQWLPDLIKEKDIQGFNVTLPHKSAILPFLTECSADAKALGAVNCVKVTSKGWIGYNTDVIGIEESIRYLFPDGPISPALVLGDGGSAKAVCHVLAKLKVPFLSLSRHPLPHQRHWNQVNADLLHAYPFLIQTTPLGMFPNGHEKPPLHLDVWPSDAVVFDLIYNPSETLFLREAREKGARILNGQRMLETQALASWEIWKKED